MDKEAEKRKASEAYEKACANAEYAYEKAVITALDAHQKRLKEIEEA